MERSGHKERKRKKIHRRGTAEGGEERGGRGAILKETAITEGRRLTRDGTRDFQERGSRAKKREMDDERG